MKLDAYIKLSKSLYNYKKKYPEILEKAIELSKIINHSSYYTDLLEELTSQGEVKKSIDLVFSIPKQINDYGTEPAYKFHVKSYYKFQVFLKEFSKIIMNLGEKDKTIAVIELITDSKLKSTAYAEIASIQKRKLQNERSLEILKQIERGSERLYAYIQFGKTLPFEEAQNILKTITNEENKNAIVKGVSENIHVKMEFSKDVNPYLYNYSYYTQNLSNILFNQAKMACFFEEEPNEEKLDMLNEVLDIKDWRRISASA